MGAAMGGPMGPGAVMVRMFHLLPVLFVGAQTWYILAAWYAASNTHGEWYGNAVCVFSMRSGQSCVVYMRAEYA